MILWATFEVFGVFGVFVARLGFADAEYLIRLLRAFRSAVPTANFRGRRRFLGETGEMGMSEGSVGVPGRIRFSRAEK